MIRLSKDQIIHLHDELIIETGGSRGIKDKKPLDSAISAAFQSFDKIDLFSSIQEKAAR